MSKSVKSADSKGFHVLIAAAGTGLRTGFDTPKQYKTIAGKTVLRHTIEKFMGIQGLKSIRVIINPAHLDFYQKATADLPLSPPVHGADTRKKSVYKGLLSFSAKDHGDIVLIHDAARPFVDVHSILRLLDEMKTSSCATLAAPLADTIVTSGYKTLDRTALHSIQTPQGFRIGDLKSAHEKFLDDNNFTDDCGLMAGIGMNVTLVQSSRDNFKITTNEDFMMAEKLLSTQTQTRIGFGYDVHAFDTAPATATRLGGVSIPHNRKLLGHSDADVVLHALTDALLGTIGDGDIGQIFPPSDNQWKNADSEIFVTEALRRVHEQGGKIINADITLIAEEPKIGAHRTAIQTRLASLLALPVSRVGLKATTSEGLGFVGERKGIEAKAIVSVSFPAEME